MKVAAPPYSPPVETLHHAQHDDVTLGGLGLASAEIDRQVVAPTAPTQMVAPAVPEEQAEVAE